MCAYDSAVLSAGCPASPPAVHTAEHTVLTTTIIIAIMKTIMITIVENTAVLPAGCPAVWPTWHRQDPAGTGGGAPHRLYLHQGLWQRAGTEVHRRGQSHGQRTVCHGQVTLLPVHLCVSSVCMSVLHLGSQQRAFAWSGSCSTQSGESSGAPVLN